MRKWWWIVPVVVVVGAGVAWLTKRKPPAPVAEAPTYAPLQCRFQAGQELAFRYARRVEPLAVQGQNVQAQGARAVMHWRVLSPTTPNEWLLAGRVDDLTVDGASQPPADLEGIAGVPFLFRMSGDCRFADFGFLPTMRVEPRKRLVAMLQDTEVLVHPQMGKEWLRSHTNLNGNYTASYERRPPGADGNPRFVRRNNGYTRLAAGTPANVQIELEEANATVVFDGAGAWVRSLDSGARTRLLQDGKPVWDLRATVKVERDDALNPFPASDALRDLAKFVFGARALEPTSADLVATPPAPPDPRWKDAPLQSAIDELVAQLRSGTDAGKFAGRDALVAWLRLNPEGARDLLDLIRRGGVSGVPKAVAWHALELAGTKQAHEVLLRAVRDVGLGGENRNQALAALAEVPSPTKETLKALVDVSRERSSDPNDPYHTSAQALLAMGILTDHADKSMPELAAAAREELKSRLAGAKRDEDIAALVDAVYNTHDEAFTPELTALQHSESPVVRDHVARAYAGMEPMVRDPNLSLWFPLEKDDGIREDIGRSLLTGAQSNPDGAAALEVIAMCAARLAYEPNPRLRRLLIDILGTASATNKEAKEAICGWYGRETDPDTLFEIGRFCSIADLHR